MHVLESLGKLNTRTKDMSHTLSLSLQIWSFSKVMSGVNAWYHADSPAMGNHMMTCEHYAREPYDPNQLWSLLDLTKLHSRYMGVVDRNTVNFTAK